MYINVLTCEECECYKLKVKCSDRPDMYECTRWNRIVDASDYCSKATRAFTCRRCEHCRSLAGSEDKYLCTRERMAYYTALDYSCSYYEKRKEINNEKMDC